MIAMSKLVRILGPFLLLCFLQGCGGGAEEGDAECDDLEDGDSCGDGDGFCCRGVCDESDNFCADCSAELDDTYCSDGTDFGVCCDELCVTEQSTCEGNACDEDISALVSFIDSAAFAGYMRDNPLGNTFTASDGASTATAETFTDLTCIGSGIVPEAALDFPSMACKEAAVHCPIGSIVSAPGDGDHLVLTMVVNGMVPLADPTWLFQYGFVFDSDGAPGNNWAPISAYPLDFFGGADLWIEFLYDPDNGPSVQVSDITAGNTITPRASTAAKVVLVGNVLMAVIPVSEVGTPANITYRGSAFKHQGAFVNGPWNGDAFPAPPDPLTPVQ